jgi:cytochrome oxidase assembly protein ShyY1
LKTPIDTQQRRVELRHRKLFGPISGEEIRTSMTEASTPPPPAPAAGRTPGKHWLLTGRWLSLLLLAVLAVPGCVELGRWQLHRLHHAQSDNRLIRDNSRVTPQPVDQLTSVGGTVTNDRRWRTVEVRGTYDPGHTLLVRNRARDGELGYQVLTPVVTGDGTAALVDRGWIAVPQSGAVPEVPIPPSDPVVVTGLLRPTETQPRRGPHDSSDVPSGQVVRIDVPRISGGLPYPVYAGYVDLRAQDPPAPVVDGSSVPDPNPLPGSETEMLHLAYASQWFVFAGIAPLGFLLLLRREADDRRAALARAHAGDATSPGGASPIRPRSSAEATGS